MIVSELIAKLQQMPQDLDVYAEPVSDEKEWEVEEVKQEIIWVERYEQIKQDGHSWGRHWRESENAVILGIT